jgi:hypothetical protein
MPPIAGGSRPIAGVVPLSSVGCAAYRGRGWAAWGDAGVRGGGVALLPSPGGLHLLTFLGGLHRLPNTR